MRFAAVHRTYCRWTHSTISHRTSTAFHIHHAQEEAKVPFAEEAGTSWSYIRRRAALTGIACPPGLVTMVPLFSLTAPRTKCRSEDILPAEMGSQGEHTSIPWRAVAGEEVEAAIQEEFARGSAHGP